MRIRSAITTTVICIGTAALLGGASSGCDTILPTAGLFLPPLGSITWEQRGDMPNFTVTLDAAGAVSAPDLVTKVNWVFGDGTGFVTLTDNDKLKPQHRYETAGSFTVTAYFFDANDFVDARSATVKIVVAEKATGPFPEIGATGVPVAATLTWTPGNRASRSTVFLSTDRAAVAAAAAAALRGELDEATLSPTDLTGGTTYFWRVDSATIRDTVAGDVWEFTTAPTPAPVIDALPADGEAEVALDASLTWTAGAGSDSHDVYFGTGAAAVADASLTSDEFQGSQDTTQFTPAETLLPATDYFWRIDEVGLGGTTRGAVLHFSTADVPGVITDPVPADGATDVPVTTTLSWTADVAAASHDVYFGTSFDAVDSADREGPLFRGNQTETTFEPTLGADLTLFWRVDEVGPSGVTKGAILEFTTAVAPTQASDLMPVDGDIEVSVTPVLSWTAGDAVDEHLVFFGADRDAVTAADAGDDTGILVATLDAATVTFEPGVDLALDENTTYFWRIDERGAGGVTRSATIGFTTRDPIRADVPSPTLGAEDVLLDTALTWAAGDQGGPPLNHDVYLGTGEAAVTGATTSSPEFMGNFPAGTLAFAPLQALQPGTDYFWRIDERYDPNNAAVDTEVATGKVWRFTTVLNPPAPADRPQPGNGVTDVDLEADLSWTAGDDATSHDVYFGTDATMVSAADRTTAGVFKGNFAAAAFALATLDAGVTYYWRIDEVNDAGTTAGDVWSFTALAEPGLILDAAPADAAVDVGVAVRLGWTAADGALSHDVYFDADETAVMNGVRGSAAFQSNQTGTTLDPGPLMPDTPYFWRVDEVNDAGTTTGTVFTFTTGTLPGPASGPMPANQATDVATDAVLSWTVGSGGGLITHDVYFGTTESDVRNATRDAPAGVFVGNQSTTTFDRGTLLRDTVYFWRIDEVGTGDTRRGDVWQFRSAPAPTQAALVTASGDGPANTATGIAVTPTLQWTSGTGAGTVTHDVYFGTVRTDVESATRADPEFLLNQAANTFMPGATTPLSPGTRFFWRIDTVDSLGGTTHG
ncbi:MAG: hypothetical protein ACE5F9_11695, partial [Phycisphaerae bacterium]